MEPRLGDIAKGGLAKVQNTKYLLRDFWTFAKPPFAMSPDKRSKGKAASAPRVCVYGRSAYNRWNRNPQPQLELQIISLESYDNI